MDNGIVHMLGTKKKAFDSSFVLNWRISVRYTASFLKSCFESCLLSVHSSAFKV